MRHSKRIAVGPVRFRIGRDWRAPVAALGRLYAGYPQDDTRPADATVRLFAARPWRRWLRPSVQIGGDFTVPDALPLPLSMGLLAAEMGMNLQVALGWRRHMLLHASAVARDGRAVILSGESGSGKSTLAALLGEGAWRLMGDEFTLIEPGRGDALGFPRAVSLKNAAIAEMAARVDPARLGPLHAVVAHSLGALAATPGVEAQLRSHMAASIRVGLSPAQLREVTRGLHEWGDAAAADRALRMLEVDNEGLDALDHRYLSCIARNYDGGPVGIETISAALSEPRDALEEVVEPFLLQQGFIGRTPRGRVLTLRAYRHLGLTGPSRASSPQIGLFEVQDDDDAAASGG